MCALLISAFTELIVIPTRHLFPPGPRACRSPEISTRFVEAGGAAELEMCRRRGTHSSFVFPRAVSRNSNISPTASNTILPALPMSLAPGPAHHPPTFQLDFLGVPRAGSRIQFKVCSARHLEAQNVNFFSAAGFSVGDGSLDRPPASQSIHYNDRVLAGFKNRAPPTVGIKFSEDLT
ncbi:hypothetical protein DFH09DRAFT_1077555 [Mycena vulgaris]|nr:hypothetical protein DFH09DRAFT_1077555 [Mycena vulgaris]